MLRRSRIKTLNRWFLPILAVFVLAFTLFPSQVLSLIAPRTSTDLRTGEDQTIITLSVPGMT